MRVLLLIFCLCLTLPVWAGNGKLTAAQFRAIESTRQEALRKALPYVDLSDFKAQDPQFPQNQALIKDQQTESEDRCLTVYKNGDYVVSVTGEYYARTYDHQGQLLQVGFSSVPHAPQRTFPHYTHVYQYPDGELNYTLLYTAPGEVYAFDPEGQLSGYCLQSECFQPDGTPEQSRYEVSE